MFALKPFRYAVLTAGLTACAIVICAPPVGSDTTLAQSGGRGRAGSIAASAEEPPEFPDIKQVDSAKELLGKVKPEFVRTLAALRVLTNRAADVERLPATRRIEFLPAFGETKAKEGGKLASWALLRIAAFLRTGYPDGQDLQAEIAGYLATPMTKGEVLPWQTLSLELLTLDAIALRDTSGKGAAAAARAKPLLKPVEWTKKFAGAPDSAGLRALFHEALCRHIASGRGWANTPGGWKDVVKELCDLLNENESGKGAIWPQASGTERQRLYNFCFLGAILGLAAADPEIGTGKGSLKKSYDAALEHLRARTTELCKDLPLGAGIGGDLCALAALMPEESLPGQLWPKLRKVPEAAMPLPDSPYFGDTRANYAGLCVELGWFEPPRKQDGLPTVASIGDVQSLCLALLGTQGGLAAPDKAPEELPRDDLAIAFDALTTVEIDAAKAHEPFKHPPLLAARINRTVDKALDWLKGQCKGRNLPGAYGGKLGGQALAVLALMDAGVARDDVLVKDWMKRLRGARPSVTLDGPTYSYGIALMALQKFYEHEQDEAKILDAKTKDEYDAARKAVWDKVDAKDREWIKEMVAVLTRDSAGFGWGYTSPAIKAREGPVKPLEPAYSDNSNSQYAIMGLKAAALLGATFERTILHDEMRRLMAEFNADKLAGKFKLRLDGKGALLAPGQSAEGERVEDAYPGGWPYFGKGDPKAGLTAACVTSLVICRDELDACGMLMDEERASVNRIIAGGLFWIGKNTPYRHPISENRLAYIRRDEEGFGLCYDLYAIERAGVLTRTEFMAGVDWYREGAEILMALQADDGRWPDLMDGKNKKFADVCMAILFLKRAALPTQSTRIITGEAHKKPGDAKEPNSRRNGIVLSRRPAAVARPTAAPRFRTSRA